MRIIVLVKHYPPLPSPSGSLVRNMVEHMAKSHAVVVVTRASVPVDPGVERAGSIEIRRLPERAPSRAPRLANRMAVRLRRWIGAVSDARDRSEVTSELRRLRLTSEDLVVPCTVDEIIAATELRRLQPFTLVPFMLEVLPQGPSIPSVPEIVRSLGQRRRRRVQEAILDGADHTIALPAAYAALLREHEDRRGRFTRVEHPMIRELTSRKDPHQVADHPEGVPIRVVYAGGLDRRQRNPIPVLETLERVAVDMPVRADFYSYGNCESLLEEPRFSDWLVAHGRVSPGAAEEALKDAGVVLTIANAGGDLVPSKIFDCMSTGRPIIHFFHRDDDPYLDYLRRYKLACWIQIGTDVQASADAIIEFVGRTRRRTVSFASLLETFPECTPGAVCDVLLGKASGAVAHR